MATIQYTVLPEKRFFSEIAEQREGMVLLKELDHAFRHEYRRPITWDDLRTPPMVGPMSMIVGRLHGEIVSFARLIEVQRYDHSDLSYYRIEKEESDRFVIVSSLMVVRKQRLRGCARQLLERIVEWTGKRRLMLRVLKNNLDGLICYLKTGFVFVDYMDDDYLMERVEN